MFLSELNGFSVVNIILENYKDLQPTFEKEIVPYVDYQMQVGGPCGYKRTL